MILTFQKKSNITGCMVGISGMQYCQYWLDEYQLPQSPKSFFTKRQFTRIF